jgi:hyperosmotically inducible protein
MSEKSRNLIPAGRWKFIFALLLFPGAMASAHCQSASQETKVHSDQGITEKIEDKLSEDPGLGGQQIRVQTKNGVVYLNGKVDTPTERAEIASLAGEVPGVNKVQNDLYLNNG